MNNVERPVVEKEDILDWTSDIFICKSIYLLQSTYSNQNFVAAASYMKHAINENSNMQTSYRFIL